MTVESVTRQTLTPHPWWGRFRHYIFEHHLELIKSCIQIFIYYNCYKRIENNKIPGS